MLEACWKPVKSNEIGIQCVEWDPWFHVRRDCCDLSHEMYEILANSSFSWICPLCGFPIFSVSFIDNSLHSFYSCNSFDPLNHCDSEVSPPQPNCKQTSTKTTRFFFFKRKRNPRRNCVAVFFSQRLFLAVSVSFQ